MLLEKTNTAPESPILPTWSLVIGTTVFAAQACLTIADPFAVPWSVTLLLLGPLVIFPLVLEVLARETQSSICRAASQLQLPAALLLTAALNLSAGWLAVLLGLPWIAVCLLLAVNGALRIVSDRRWDAAKRSIDMGQAYLAIAAVWLAAHLSGIEVPMFEPVIVFLTVVHFHYAGFLLPMFLGWGIEWSETRRPWHGLVSISAILAIPAVATGVTLTKLQMALLFEPVAAVWMAASSLAAGWVIWKMAQSNPFLQLAAQTFVFTMPLAIAYAVRPLFPESLSVLDIPAMRALHGTGNAIGFGLLGAIGFFLHRKRANMAADGLSRRRADSGSTE